MYLLLSTLWFIWEIRYILFWLYLWQLKDYHVGRFVDHFSTHKGRKLIFNFSQTLKLVLLILFLADSPLFVYLFLTLFLFYLAEAVLFFKAVAQNSVKKPARTFKTIFLLIVSFLVIIFLLFWTFSLKDGSQPVWLLIFDILTPIIISAIVLFFQPFFVVARNVIMVKAKNKMARIKSASALKVIAITGSYGKTSTKEFLSTILSKKYKVLKTKDHQNSEIGVAKCILNGLEPSHEIFIAEVGAYNKGKVKEVCSMLDPNIGVVTGVNEQHLALFGSIKNLLSAEGGGELAHTLPADGTLFLNGDNKYCLDLYKRTENLASGQKKIYSLNSEVINSDIWADGIEIKKDGVSFLAIDKSGEMMHFDVKVLGKQNVQNLLGAILIAKELGMSFGEISEACKDILQPQAGMTLKREKHGIFVIDSSYSSNPDGVFADLDYLSVFEGKKIIVMPCLIELGRKSSEIHEKIGRKISEVCDMAIITSNDKFKEIKKSAVGAGMEERNILLCDKPQDIYSIITLFCKSGDAVLLEGRVPRQLIKLLND